MKSTEKTKEQLVKKIDFLEKQIKKLREKEPLLKHKEKEIKEFDKILKDRVESRTSAERIVQRQLHSEIEHRKRAEQIVLDALEFANGVINTVREPLIVLNADLKVISASRFFYQIFKVKPEDTEKQHIYDLGNRQWDIPKLRELLENILPNATSFDNFEVEHNFPGVGTRIMLLNAREIYQKVNRTKLILLAMEDITHRKEMEKKGYNYLI